MITKAMESRMDAEVCHGGYWGGSAYRLMDELAASNADDTRAAPALTARRSSTDERFQ